MCVCVGGGGGVGATYMSCSFRCHSYGSDQHGTRVCRPKMCVCVWGGGGGGCVCVTKAEITTNTAQQQAAPFLLRIRSAVCRPKMPCLCVCDGVCGLF